MHVNDITGQIIGAAMKVHTALGPGLLENAYRACVAHEPRKAGLNIQSEVELPVIYDGMRVNLGYRLDLLVEDLVIVELKSVEALLPVHQAQLISYLKLSTRHVGLLINFKVDRLKDGIRRLVVGQGWSDVSQGSSVASVVKSS